MKVVWSIIKYSSIKEMSTSFFSLIKQEKRNKRPRTAHNYGGGRAHIVEFSSEFGGFSVSFLRCGPLIPNKVN